MKRAIIMLGVLLGGLASGSGTSFAQWTEGPVFESDARRRAEQEEAERAARRKTYEPVVYPKYMEGGARPDIKPVAPPIVYFDQAEQAGSIIVDTKNRKLYYVLPDKKAYAYPISVGREGFTWSGTEKISRIAEWPSWTPPPEMRQRIPGLPITVSGGMDNPQGARALYLGNTVYRIHGTNNERTVGRANSSGCFRLSNEHVVHLASIAKVGTTVKVLEAYNANVSETPPLSSLFDIFGSEPEPAPAPKKKPKKAAQIKKPATPAGAATPPAAVGTANAAPAAQAAAATDTSGTAAAVAPAPTPTPQAAASAPSAQPAATQAATAPQAASDPAASLAKKAE